MEILDLANSRYVKHQLTGVTITCLSKLVQRVDGTSYLIGGTTEVMTETYSCVFKIDPNLNVTKMMPMLKARAFFTPIFVQDRYILAISGHSDAS